MPVSLDLHAHVVVSIGADDVVVQAEHANITVHLPTLRLGLAYARQWPTRRQRVEFLDRVHAGLTVAGLRVRVQLAGSTIARLGAQSCPGLASRLLGLGSLEVRLTRLVGAMWSRRRATPAL